MPRSFNEKEKQDLRKKIHTITKNHLAQGSIKKLSIDEIVAYAGISKGSFYAFYPSKESIVIDIFDELEVSEQDFLLKESEKANSLEDFFFILFDSFDSFMLRNPVAKIFTNLTELERIFSNLEPEQIQKLYSRDLRFAQVCLEIAKNKGWKVKIDEKTIVEIARFFFLHAIAQEQFPHMQVSKDITKLIISSLVEKLRGDS